MLFPVTFGDCLNTLQTTELHSVVLSRLLLFLAFKRWQAYIMCIPVYNTSMHYYLRPLFVTQAILQLSVV